MSRNVSAVTTNRTGMIHNSRRTKYLIISVLGLLLDDWRSELPLRDPGPPA